MSLFNSINETTDKATNIGEKYFIASRDYFKLKLFKQTAIGLSYFSKLLIYSILLMLVIIFVSISGAFAIGNALESLSLGFLIVGGILLVITIIAFLLSKYIDNTIIKNLSKKFFK